MGQLDVGTEPFCQGSFLNTEMHGGLLNKRYDKRSKFQLSIT